MICHTQERELIIIFTALNNVKSHCAQSCGMAMQVETVSAVLRALRHRKKAKFCYQLLPS